MENMKLLLIDDNERLAEVYKEILNIGGYQSELQTNSDMAFQSILSTKPDMIFLDLMMEPLSGWDVLEQIRGNPETEDIPVIILTGKIITPEEIMKYGLLIDNYVMKPLEGAILLGVTRDIERIINEFNAEYEAEIAAGSPPEVAKKHLKNRYMEKRLESMMNILKKQERMMAGTGDQVTEFENNAKMMTDFIEKELKRIKSEK